MVTQLDPRIKLLHAILDPLGDLIVACSGGVDSSFLLKVAFDRGQTTGHRVVGILGRSHSVAEEELAMAREVARQVGTTLSIVDTGEMNDPRYRANPVDRCYYCKDDLYTRLSRLAADQGFDTVIDGANADDADDYRPGMEAARNHNVASPLMEAGLTKDDIRELSRALGLPTWDKPAAPCLSSRIAYGEPITPEKLQRVEKGEQVIRSFGFPVVRVRSHGDMARIEVPTDQIERLVIPAVREEVVGKLRELGFMFVAVDAEGFRSGNLNRAINSTAKNRD